MHCAILLSTENSQTHCRFFALTAPQITQPSTVPILEQGRTREDAAVQCTSSEGGMETGRAVSRRSADANALAAALFHGAYIKYTGGAFY